MKLPRLLVCWFTSLTVAAQTTLPRAASNGDPYTTDPAVRAGAGVVAIGRFVWADHTTADIQSLMGFEPFQFLETEHFKFACSLSPSKLPQDRLARAELLTELAALRKVLPTAPEQPTSLDAWLRVHVFAHRLDALRRSYVGHFGTPAPEGRKTLVMLCRSGASVGTYARNYLECNAPRRSLRLHLVTGDDLLATAEQMPDEDLGDDVRLHAAVTYHLVRLWTARACGGDARVPAWLGEGVGQWFSTRMVTNADYFAGPVHELPETPREPSWAANVRGRVDAGWQPEASALFARDTAADLRFVDHLEAWSRVDFLIRNHKPALPLVLRMLRQGEGDGASRSAYALRTVLGIELATFDAQWRRFAAASYRKD